MRKITRAKKVKTFRESVKRSDGTSRTNSRKNTIIKVTASDITKL